MEKVENINIQFSGDKFPENPIVIHLLEGPAPTPFRTIDPVKKRIEGDINSVKEFIKNNLLKADKAVVYYSDNPANPWIELQVNPEDELAPVVKGVLSPNPDLKAFFFNEKAAFKNDTFIDVIKKYAHCFKSKEEAKVLIKTLTNFKAKFSTEVERLDDKQGNTKNMVNTILDIEKGKIPNEIVFNMPLFDGMPSYEFVVDVEIDVVTNNNGPEARFGFYSMDLTLMLREQAKGIMEEKIDDILDSDLPLTCIRKNS